MACTAKFCYICIITSEQEQTLSAKPDAKRAANEYNVHKSQFKSIHMLRKKIFSEKDIKIFIGTYTYII